MMTSWKEGRRKIPSNKSSCSLRTVPARREASSLLLSASMTVEAAAVLPLFLFLMANLLYLTEMVRVQSAAEAALYETAAALAEYAFYLEPETAGAAGGSGPARKSCRSSGKRWLRRFQKPGRLGMYSSGCGKPAFPEEPWRGRSHWPDRRSTPGAAGSVCQPGFPYAPCSA